MMFPGLISLVSAVIAMLFAELLFRRRQPGVALVSLGVAGFLIVYAVALHVGVIRPGGTL